MTNILGKKGVEAFERRGLCPETVARLGVYTGKQNAGGIVEPSETGSIIVFPFLENGIPVNEKYRAAPKKFWQSQGGWRTFWNSDVLDDPALENGTQALVITEGEIDAITAIDCGFPLTVSVPDGAPAAVTSNRVGEEIEETGKFQFLWNNRDRLRRIKRFIIAVDNDEAGKRLASELVRRLSAARCLWVTYPEGCKDLNEILLAQGADAVRGVLRFAQPYPVKGVFQLKDYPERPEVQTFSTGWGTMDELMRMFTPSLTVVTGIPGYGKSTWVTNLIVNLAERHGWKSAMFSPEMPVIPHMRDKMRRIIGRDSIDGLSEEKLVKVDQWINSHFLFLDHDAHGEEEDITLDWILERAVDAVLRYGIRVLVIDPWNEIEHARRRDEMMVDYIGRAIRALKRFAQRYDVAVIIIAHPTKEVGKDGKVRVPSLYDIDGAAHWFNKPDFGVVIDIPNANEPKSAIHVLKVRFDGTGKKGKAIMEFDERTTRYSLLSTDS